MTGSTPHKAPTAPYAAHAFWSASPRYELPSEEANGWDRKVLTTMQHQQVIENFVRNGQGGRGTYLKADEDVLYSKFSAVYRPYGRYTWRNEDETTPLA